MKTKTVPIILMLIPLLSFSNASFEQAPNLRSAANFVFFTTTGAVSNAGISQITGNVGSNAGAISGFGGLTGVIDSVNAISLQASVDLLAAYNQLNSAIPTFFPAVVLGNGQVLDSGVYLIGAATSLNLRLTLDAQGDPSAVFIIQITGAFSTNAGSSVALINGASACNVFWKVEGAFSMAAGSTMRGTVITNNAAISMTPGDTLEGRALSTTGAIALNGVVAVNGCGAFMILPLTVMSFTGACQSQDVLLQWSTATATNINYFTVERSADGIKWLTVGSVEGAGSSTFQPTYSLTDNSVNQGISYYRLKQTYIGGMSTYGTVIIVQKCGSDAVEKVTIYPNPCIGKFTLAFAGDKSQVDGTEIFNAQGGKVYESTGYQSNFDLSNAPPGMYFVQIHMYSKNITQKIIVER